MNNINQLPLEVLIEIFLKTDGLTLGKCRRVCKKWLEILNDCDQIWHKVCRNEYKYSSKLAKRKTGDDCEWYHIYKNLFMWSEIGNFEKKVCESYCFHTEDKSHALEVDYSVLPIRYKRGIVLYDTSTFKYIPVVVPTRDCLKITNNNKNTVLLLKAGLFLQRNVDDPSYMSEAFFNADNYTLCLDTLYFYNDRDVFKCNLLDKNLNSELMFHCQYDIKEMQYSDGFLHLFTDCGKILTVHKSSIKEKLINCPPEWVRQIKHICVLDDKNYVCYSSSLFIIETDKYRHTYLSTSFDFPTITALFFYSEVVLMGTRDGEILLYRLSDQQEATTPIFEKLATLPNGHFPVNLDVFERSTGPIIVIATLCNVILLETKFFPHEPSLPPKISDKLLMYKRLFRLKDRLQLANLDT